jgi:hypothetical protein
MKLLHITNKYVAVLNYPHQTTYAIYTKEPIYQAVTELPRDMIEVGNDWIEEESLEVIEMEINNKLNLI